ncbi:hypothetical protein QP934_002200 [Corynebacterium sp. MSK122]|uniref:hypothetical protein n=1 Tax=Corynebacterium sp. MSK122 TaxID=3050206 RepID=UPI003AF13D7F
MATNKQIERSLNRAQKLRERQKALAEKVREAEREADRIVGQALREGATDSRSRWAKYRHLNMMEFYSLAVAGGASPAEPENRGSDSGEATADEVGGNQGY